MELVQGVVVETVGTDEIAEAGSTVGGCWRLRGELPPLARTIQGSSRMCFSVMVSSVIDTIASFELAVSVGTSRQTLFMEGTASQAVTGDAGTNGCPLLTAILAIWLAV